MNNAFKPYGYNSVSPYFIIEDAQRFINLITEIFDAKELRRFDTSDGKIMHAELKIDDSVIMLSDASEKYPAITLIIHVYVKDVNATFEKAILAGCKVLEKPTTREGDPDRRGTFIDYAKNMWSVSTQL